VCASANILLSTSSCHTHTRAQTHTSTQTRTLSLALFPFLSPLSRALHTHTHTHTNSRLMHTHAHHTPALTSATPHTHAHPTHAPSHSRIRSTHTLTHTQAVTEPTTHSATTWPCDASSIESVSTLFKSLDDKGVDLELVVFNPSRRECVGEWIRAPECSRWAPRCLLSDRRCLRTFVWAYDVFFGHVGRLRGRRRISCVHACTRGTRTDHGDRPC